MSEVGALLQTAEGRYRRLIRIGVASQGGPITHEQFTDDPRVPIVTTLLHYADSTLELRACGHIDATGRRLDVVRWRLSASPRALAPGTSVRVEVLGDEASIIANQTLRAETATAPRTTEAQVFLGTALVGSFAVLLDGPSTQSEMLPSGWAEQAFAIERRFWHGAVQWPDRFEIPDRGIMDLLAAAARTTAQLQPREGIVGSGPPAYSALLRSRDAAVDRLYTFANRAAPTGVWVVGENGEMPDSGAPMEFMQLVRDLLVFELDDQLEVLPAVPLVWFQTGSPLAVERARTRFGAVSVRVRVDPRDEVHVELDADWVRPPSQIVLRCPPGAHDATVDGRPARDHGGGLELPAAARIIASFVLPDRVTRVVGHANVKTALRDWTRYSSASPFKPDIRTYRQYPLESDGPAHDAYRVILAPWFERRKVADLEPQLRAIAAEIAESFASVGKMDAVTQLALPMMVRSLALTLGRPHDVEEWLSWGVDINMINGRRDGRGTDAYLTKVFDEVLHQPSDDVFSHIATFTPPDRPLTHRERLGLGSMVLTAGRAAVVNLISGTIWWLADHPAERARLAAEPTRVAMAIDEMLRYLSPAPELDRAIIGDIDGVPPESRVLISFVSANHDPSVFRDPEMVVLDRRPNQHLAFGSGPHTCLGAHLARLEATVFVEELLRVVPKFRRMSDAELTWQNVGEAMVPRDFISVPIEAGE